jgi:hypothetical protein
VEGEGELLADGKTYRIKEGMAMLLLKGISHEYYAVSSVWTVDWIVFDGHQVEHFLKHTAGVKTSGALYVSRPDIFLSKIRSVVDSDDSDDTLKGLKYSSILYSLLTDIVQYTSINPNSSASDQYFRLRPLFHYIEQNFDKPLTLEAMAEVIGVTPQHLCTLFKNDEYKDFPVYPFRSNLACFMQARSRIGAPHSGSPQRSAFLNCR